MKTKARAIYGTSLRRRVQAAGVRKVAELFGSLGKERACKLFERREMRLQASINGLLNAHLSGKAGTHRRVDHSVAVYNHQVELSWPLRTVMAEMPRLVTSMCSVFHGKIAFPFLSSPIKKVYFGGRLSSRGASKSGEFFNVVPEAKLLNVIWPDSTELISGIRGTI